MPLQGCPIVSPSTRPSLRNPELPLPSTARLSPAKARGLRDGDYGENDAPARGLPSPECWPWHTAAGSLAQRRASATRLAD